MFILIELMRKYERLFNTIPLRIIKRKEQLIFIFWHQIRSKHKFPSKIQQILLHVKWFIEMFRIVIWTE